MYEFVKKTARLYEALQDEVSKEIFWARLQYDIEPSMTNTVNLMRLSGNIELNEWVHIKNWKADLCSQLEKKKKFILYGTGFTGQSLATALQLDGIDFFGFCGRRAAAFSDGLMGKTVISPDYLVAHASEYFVIIAATGSSSNEILTLLQKNQFPKDHILTYFDSPVKSVPYFEFPTLFPKGTAFIDGGSFDGGDSLRFVEYCQGQYSTILAFEPDEKNFQKCRQCGEANQIRDFQMIQAGLAEDNGTASFVSKSSVGSYMVKSTSLNLDDSEEIVIDKIYTVTIDKSVGAQTIGFIKMDIEGAEFDALHGAKETIVRDTPLLAICIYHRQGDMLAIMEYLHQLVPEYHFWLRHYGPFMMDTVLYASIDSLE